MLNKQIMNLMIVLQGLRLVWWGWKEYLKKDLSSSSSSSFFFPFKIKKAKSPYLRSFLILFCLQFFPLVQNNIVFGEGFFLKDIDVCAACSTQHSATKERNY